LATRVELFDFVTAELVAREHLDSKRIRPVRIALKNQRDDLLAFAAQIENQAQTTLPRICCNFAALSTGNRSKIR